MKGLDELSTPAKLMKKQRKKEIKPKKERCENIRCNEMESLIVYLTLEQKTETEKRIKNLEIHKDFLHWGVKYVYCEIKKEFYPKNIKNKL